MFNVTFEPYSRSNWHRHSSGQILIATAGIGYYQENGKPARRLYPGDIVEVSSNVEHWHGAAPDSWFAHVVMECNHGHNKVIWNMPVSADAYFFCSRKASEKYAEANAVLSRRQQAIVALGAYTGRGDMEHIDSAFIECLEAAMTVNEIKEILVHAYPYAGFPRSIRALMKLKSLIDKRALADFYDYVGPEATPLPDMDDSEKYALGRKNLEILCGSKPDDQKAEYALFSQVIDKFIVEHIYADIFSRNLITWSDRELATVSIVAGVGDAEPIAAAHMGICARLGMTPSHLTALLNIVETKLGPQYSTPLRRYVQCFRK